MISKLLGGQGETGEEGRVGTESKGTQAGQPPCPQ